jgi:hypothetical protein
VRGLLSVLLSGAKDCGLERFNVLLQLFPVGRGDLARASARRRRKTVRSDVGRRRIFLRGDGRN